MLQDFAKRTEMQIRTRLPNWVRQSYRLLNAARKPAPIEGLPEDLLQDCSFCASRLVMLERLPKHGVVAELGTYRGDFARDILQLNQPRQLHLIDIDYSHFQAEGLTGPELTRHVGFTAKTIATFPDAHFDWIYIDADHSYAGCLADAEASAAKVKPGGYIAFNDFAHIDPWLGSYGVGRAAVAFAKAHRWPMAFFCFHAAGLYDVAFRKPT